jgi:formiminoglutamase
VKTPTIPDETRQQLSSRSETKNITIMNNNLNPEVIMINSPSDIGVIRNGGRQGSFLGPKVLVNELSKFQKSSHEVKSLQIKQVTKLEDEIKDFESSQNEQYNNIEKILSNHPKTPVIHLGGGHDHIFPFLLALENQHPDKSLNIINIDAHLDTRQDTYAHSGTPFRQFDHKAQRKFQLTQIGIQNEANTKENFTPLSKGVMNIELISKPSPQRAEQLSHLLEKCIMQGDWVNILSIDLDILDASEFKSCSAVNPSGLLFSEIEKIINTFMNNKLNKYFGFYEYNPLYDDLSNSDGKKIAWLLNQIVKDL